MTLDTPDATSEALAAMTELVRDLLAWARTMQGLAELVDELREGGHDS